MSETNMKKKFVTRNLEVIAIFEIEVSIAEECLTDEWKNEFEQGFWKIKGPDDLFKYAAQCLAGDSPERFIEGLGQVKTWDHLEDYNVSYKQTNEDWEAKIIK